METSIDGLILDQLRIDRSRNQLLLGIRGLGDFYVRKHLHCYVTKPLGPPQLSEVLGQINADETLKAYEKKVFDTDNGDAFNIVQLYAPIGIGQALASQFKSKVKDEKGKYHERPYGSAAFYARASVGCVGSVVTVDSRLSDALRAKAALDTLLSDFEQSMADSFSQYGPAYRTRLSHALDESFRNYDGQDMEQVQHSLRQSPLWKKHCEAQQHLIQRKKNIHDKLRQLEKDLAPLQGSLEIEGSAAIMALDDWKPYLKVQRMMSLDEICKESWCFIDIEIPKYKTPENAEVSWIGISFQKEGALERKILTTRKFEAIEIDQYQMQYYDSESALVAAAEKLIQENDPLFVVAYNANFDLIQLRETEHGFAIGAAESNPKKDITLKLFERINVRKRIVIDALRFAKAAFGYLPNQKLEMAAQQLGLQFHKIAKHSDLAAMEEEHPQLLASYLASDVEVLCKFFTQSEIGRKALEDYAWMSQKFQLELRALVHSPGAINEAQNRSYFRALGTYREAVYPKFAHLIEFERESMHQFGSMVKAYIPVPMHKGLYEKLTKVFLPVGDYLRNLVGVRQPLALDFFRYKYQFLGDCQRQYFLSQFGNALSRYLLTDYMSYAKKKRERSSYPEGAKQVAKAARKIQGNYAVKPEQVEEALRQKYSGVQKFITDHGIELIAMSDNGAFLYIRNYDPQKHLKAPFIAVDQIGLAYIVDTIHYPKHGYYHGLHTQHLCAFEQKLYDVFLQKIFTQDVRSAVQATKDAFDELLKAGASELVYYNKTSDVYSGFEQGRRIYFTPKAKEGYPIKEENGTKFMVLQDEEDDDDKSDLFGKREAQKVYIRPIDDFKPDYAVYARRIGKKIECLCSGLPVDQKQLTLL